MTADLPRAIPLEGASNLRDIGGWPSAAWLTTVALGVAAAAGLFLHWLERHKVGP